MTTTTNIQPLRIPRATYQALTPSDRARIESKAVDIKDPYVAEAKPKTPEFLEPPAPPLVIKAPPEVVAPKEANSVSLFTKLKNKGAALASLLGAAIGSATTSLQTLLQKIVGYIVAASKAVATGFQSMTQDMLNLVKGTSTKTTPAAVVDEKTPMFAEV